MIKTLEEMNGEELLYVKDMIEKYLDECKETEDIVNKKIRKINKKIKFNNKDIRRLERKIERLKSMPIDYFPFGFGTCLSVIIAVLLCNKGVTDGMESMCVWADGTGLSLIINEIINNAKQKALDNVYKDEDDLDFIRYNNNILKKQKKKLLEYKSYNKKLKDFAEN